MIAGRVRALRTEIAELASAHGRDPSTIRICAVTKTHPRDMICSAIAAGIEDIGENYLQEASAKYTDLPSVRKHFIGHVQTNKAKRIVELFDVVQSIDRHDAGVAIARAARDCGKTVRVLVQINISGTERNGVAPEEAAHLARELRAIDGLDVDGVMAIGPVTENKDEIRRAFKRARDVFREVGGSTLSLGMSGDWREAIACGATMVRLGTAIFGARQTR